MFKKHPVLTVIGGILLAIVLAFIVTGGMILHAARGSEGELRYLVVLGTSVKRSEPTPMLQDRIDAAYEFLSQNPDVICIATGYQGEWADLSEAACIRRELVEMGIDESRIWIEEQATSTKENFEYTLALIQEKTGSRPEKIGVLSSEYHLFRAGIFAAKQGVDIVTLPAKTGDPKSFVTSFLREIPLVWYYSTIG
jgi:uncharacterized SAM-binding protein YcdF (DUF218 family)